MPKKKPAAAKPTPGQPSPARPRSPKKTAAAKAAEVNPAAFVNRANTFRFVQTDKATPPPPFSTAKMFVTGPAQPRGFVQVEVPDAALDEVIAQRHAAVTHIYRTLTGMHGDLREFFPKLSDTLPTTADGILLNPDGTPAAGVSVEALEPARRRRNRWERTRWRKLAGRRRWR